MMLAHYPNTALMILLHALAAKAWRSRMPPYVIGFALLLYISSYC